jgi:hypothetical protein
MLPGKAGEGAAVDLVRGGGDDAVGDHAWAELAYRQPRR